MSTDVANTNGDFAAARDWYWDVAHPRLYRTNAFRVIELPSDARPRDVSKRLQLMEMRAKFGNGSPKKRGLLQLDPPPDESALRTAKQRLCDPRQRLIDEFFWFWPQQPGQSRMDEAITALASGRPKVAHELWTKAESDVRPNFVAKHNLAVLTHLMALDLELAAESKALSDQEQKQRDFAWQHAFARWQVLAADEDFWHYLIQRVRELDDPGLTSESVQRFRAELPLVLLSINAQMAVQAAERRNVEETRRQLSILHRSRFAKETIHESLRRAVQPIRQRISALCKAADAEVDTQAGHGEAAMLRLLQHTKLPLLILKFLLPEDHSTRTGACDEVALTALRCQIAYGNKTENWKRSAELIALVLPIAASESVRARLDENKRIVDQNNELAVCWFCQENPGDDGAAVEHKMHGDVQTHWIPGGSRTTWRTLTVKVPRCRGCKATHERQAVVGCSVVLCVVGWLAGIIAAINAESGLGIVACIAALAVGAVCAIIHVSRSNDRPSKSVRWILAAKDHPIVKKQLAEGWSHGERPAGAGQ